MLSVDPSIPGYIGGPVFWLNNDRVGNFALPELCFMVLYLGRMVWVLLHVRGIFLLFNMDADQKNGQMHIAYISIKPFFLANLEKEFSLK
jgi:hypothetical protein